MRPSSICKLTDGMIACASDMTSEVYTITVSSNGHVLCGSVTPLPSYPERCNRIQSMCHGSQNYLFLANTKGFWQFSMSQKTVERIVVLQSDSPPIVCIHSISALQDGSIAFKDQDSRQLKILQRGGGGAVKVIAGTREESNKNGSGSHSTFGQEMGVCTEGASIFVTAGQISTIKLVTKELLSFGRTSESCTVHSWCITSTNSTRIVHSKRLTRWSRQFLLTAMEPLKT